MGMTACKKPAVALRTAYRPHVLSPAPAPFLVVGEPIVSSAEAAASTLVNQNPPPTPVPRSETMIIGNYQTHVPSRTITGMKDRN